MSASVMDTLVVLDRFDDLPADVNTANQILAKVDAEILVGRDDEGYPVYYVVKPEEGWSNAE